MHQLFLCFCFFPAPSPLIFVHFEQNRLKTVPFQNFFYGYLRFNRSLWTSSCIKSDRFVRTSGEKGYSKGNVFILYDGQSDSPLIPQQQTSHVQQDHPFIGGVLNSFVLPVHRWVPLMLSFRVMPYGVILDG